MPALARADIGANAVWLQLPRARTIQHKNFLFTITSESVLAQICNDLRPQLGLIRNLSSWKCDLLLPEGYKNTSNNG